MYVIITQPVQWIFPYPSRIYVYILPAHFVTIPGCNRLLGFRYTVKMPTLGEEVVFMHANSGCGWQLTSTWPPSQAPRFFLQRPTHLQVSAYRARIIWKIGKYVGKFHKFHMVIVESWHNDAPGKQEAADGRRWPTGVVLTWAGSATVLSHYRFCHAGWTCLSVAGPQFVLHTGQISNSTLRQLSKTLYFGQWRF